MHSLYVHMVDSGRVFKVTIRSVVLAPTETLCNDAHESAGGRQSNDVLVSAGCAMMRSE